MNELSPKYLRYLMLSPKHAPNSHFGFREMRSFHPYPEGNVYSISSYSLFIRLSSLRCLGDEAGSLRLPDNAMR